MAFGNDEKNSLVGFIFGMTSSVGFSAFSVSLRWRKETPKFTTVAVAGLFCFVLAAIMILIKSQSFFSTSYNSALFSFTWNFSLYGFNFLFNRIKSNPCS